MKGIATKLVLVAATTFMVGTTMAQKKGHSKKMPSKDSIPAALPETQLPGNPDTTKPKDTLPTNQGALNRNKTVVFNDIALNSGLQGFYAVTNKELIGSKKYTLKNMQNKEA